jgi:hypothetical protein
MKNMMQSKGRFCMATQLDQVTWNSSITNELCIYNIIKLSLPHMHAVRCIRYFHMPFVPKLCRAQARGRWWRQGCIRWVGFNTF